MIMKYFPTYSSKCHAIVNKSATNRAQNTTNRTRGALNRCRGKIYL